MDGTLDQLIVVLLDPDATIAERDDAAMDLGDYDAALDVLVRVASKAAENAVVLGSCGSSIAEIWRRLGHFDETLLTSLAPAAQSEIRAAFR